MTRQEFSLEVRATQGGLRRFLVSLCAGDTALADDIAQESYMKAYLACDTFRGQSSFATWIHRIACNEFMSHRRRPRRECELSATVQHAAAEEADDSFRYQALYNAMTRLPERERMAIGLYYLQGYSTEEISKILDINIPNVRQILTRGRVHLKTALKNNI